MILLKYIKLTISLFLCLLLIGCNPKSKEINSNSIYLKVLGTIQDGGIPHLGCNKTCARKLRYDWFYELLELHKYDFILTR